MADPIVYRDAVLADLMWVIEQARLMVRDDAVRGKDEGTSVLGAGIAVSYLPPRARKPVRKILISAPFQGNVGSSRACKRALEHLRSSGIDAYWYDGRMD